MLDRPGLDDLRHDLLDGVDRDGEPDADVDAAAGGVAICELTPITSPSVFRSGPPELPGLIGASIWITWSIGDPFGEVICRWSALTIPAVTVRSRPSGLPIATTGRRPRPRPSRRAAAA